MSIPQLKRHNHRVHPCERQQKLPLLKFLLEKYADQKVLVIAVADLSALELDFDNVTLINDTQLTEQPELTADIIISLDLSSSAEQYLERLKHTSQMALILANEQEQLKLYDIEKIIGRSLNKEDIEGFEIVSKQVKDAEEAAVAAVQQQLKDKKPFKKREDRSYDKNKSFDKNKSYDKNKSFDKNKNFPKKEGDFKKKSGGKYLGKDENGKPIFSSKDKERNHRYDGTPRSEQEKRDNSKPYGKKSGRTIKIPLAKHKKD